MTLRTQLFASLLLVTGSILNPAIAADARADAKPCEAARSRAELQQLHEQMSSLAKRLAVLSKQLGQPAPQAFAYRYLADPDAGTLGLVMFPDAHGLLVEAVTPGSPAEESGTARGDRIVSVDGKPVSGKAVKPINPLSAIRAGQKTRLRIERKGKQRDVTLKAERREIPAWNALLDDRHVWRNHSGQSIDIQRSGRQPHDELARQRVLLRSFAPWWGFNLVSLNKDMGSYFATDKGALLLSKEQDSLPALKAGDVIIRTDNQQINRPEDVLREQGKKTVIASIVRHGKRMQVKLQLPENPMLVPPAPPAPPTPPPCNTNTACPAASPTRHVSAATI